jgi:glucodextranase-like protein
VVVAALALCGFLVLSGTSVLAVTFAAAGDALDSLAGGVVSRATPAPGAATTKAAPPPAPRLQAPDRALSRTATIAVRGTVPKAVLGQRGVRIRIYVNDRRAKDQPVGPKTAFRVRAVPLAHGENEIRASLVSPNGESGRSNIIDVLYDVVPPPVTINDPADAAVVNAPTATVRGTTEPGSTVTIRNVTTGRIATGPLTGGRFAITIWLASGNNALRVVAVDRGGNRVERPLTLVRGNGIVKVSLSLSRTLIYRARLPGSLSAAVTVLDPDARPIEGAAVTFSISPPGLPTSTYETTTKDGSASWTMTVPRDGAMPGRGFATVQVVLADGRVFRDTMPFNFL